LSTASAARRLAQLVGIVYNQPDQEAAIKQGDRGI
jgi:hypothetical protein